MERCACLSNLHFMDVRNKFESAKSGRYPAYQNPKDRDCDCMLRKLDKLLRIMPQKAGQRRAA